MKLKNKLMRAMFLLALLILPTSIVLAQEPIHDGDVILFGQNYSLGEGETLNGSIAVFGGNIEIEEGATVKGPVVIFGGNFSIAEDAVVKGDLATFGGNLTLAGETDGDIAIFGGQVLLQPDSIVRGDIATFGGQVTREPGAEVTGDIIHNAPPNLDAPVIPRPDVPNPPDVKVNVNPLWHVAGKAGQAVVIAAIAMLLALFLQPQLDRTANVIVRQPLMAGGYGLIVFALFPLAVVVMILTLILIPVAAIVILIMPLAWLFGVVALGQEIGERFTKAINQVWAPVFATGFGAFLLMLVTGFIELVPCVGVIPSALVALVGVGAVMMTWFGTRNPPGFIPSPSVEEVPSAS